MAKLNLRPPLLDLAGVEPLWVQPRRRYFPVCPSFHGAWQTTEKARPHTQSWHPQGFPLSVPGLGVPGANSNTVLCPGKHGLLALVVMGK